MDATTPEFATPRPAQRLADAAARMRAILLREAAAARNASLAALHGLHEEKRETLAELAAFAPDELAAAAGLPEVREALRAMLAAAEENGLILASVAGALEAVQERLREDLAAATNPGTYSVAAGRRRPFSLAASIDQRA